MMKLKHLKAVAVGSLQIKMKGRDKMKEKRDALVKIYSYFSSNCQIKYFNDISMHAYFRLEFCFDENLENVYDSIENRFLEMMGVKPR